MTVIVIIEPHPVLRFGLSQLLTETLSSTEIEGFDYEHLSNESGYGMESDLVVLSVSSTGQSRGQLDAVKLEDLFILLHKGVLRLNKYSLERIPVKVIKIGDHRESAYDLRNESI